MRTQLVWILDLGFTVVHLKERKSNSPCITGEGHFNQILPRPVTQFPEEFVKSERNTRGTQQ